MSARQLPSLYRFAVSASRWFDDIPAAARADILAHARRRELAASETVYARDEAPDGIYQVVSGLVRLTSGTGSPRELTLDYYGSGVWFGDLSALAGRRMHDAVAQRPTTLLHIGGEDLLALLTAWPAFSRALLKLESSRLRLVTTALESYAMQTLEQRLANRLLMLAASHGRETAAGLELDLHLPQDALARLIGATRQRVNQILMDWEQEGLISHGQGGRVCLRASGKLEALATL